MRRTLLLLPLAVALLLSAAPASAAPGVRYGIQDDAWLLHGPGTLERRLEELERLGVDLVRYNLRWDAVEARQGEPDWKEPDALLEGLRDRGIAAVVSVVGTPRWANGGRGPNYAPARPQDFAAFAREAATRYRWVRDWLIWNEPNQVRWLRPTTPSVYVTRLLNPGYAAIHAANPRARVAGGVTAPRANRGGVSPVDWIRGMRAAGARLDAYAHHPYPARPSDSPFEGGCAGALCETITMARIERLLSEVGRAWGGKRIWLTEYGYQTNPPDRVAGVSPARHARLLAESALRVYKAPRVDMLVHYLIRDEPDLARFQSGLYTVSGRAKPAAQAFPLPLLQTGRSGETVTLWGMVRPRTGVQRYEIQRLVGGAWRRLAATRLTSSSGYLSLRLTLPRGAVVRLWSPEDEAAGVPVALR